MTNLGTFFPAYTAEGILPADPFQVLTVTHCFLLSSLELSDTRVCGPWLRVNEP